MEVKAHDWPERFGQKWEPAFRFGSASNREFCLWKNMGKSLAEACGRFQEKLCSPFFGFGPQLNEQ